MKLRGITDKVVAWWASQATQTRREITIAAMAAMAGLALGVLVS